MIRLIRGEAIEWGLAYVVVDVGGVGYFIHTNAAASQTQANNQIVLHTYMAVRETALDLYGFLNRDELEIFMMLIDLPKIGPKSALQILNQADIGLLKEAARNNDPSYLSKLSGIGKKSAEKIVAGLREKFDDEDMSAFVSSSSNTYATHLSDTVDALITLGYPQQEARRVVLEITTTNPELENSAAVIKLALKLLNR